MATKEELQKRFGLRDHQMRSDNNGFPFAKNQWWFLGGQSVGYGDLSQDDVLRISEELSKGEVFWTYNEYDGLEVRGDFLTLVQKCVKPRMKITNGDVEFPQEK